MKTVNSYNFFEKRKKALLISETIRIIYHNYFVTSGFLYKKDPLGRFYVSLQMDLVFIFYNFGG